MQSRDELFLASSAQIKFMSKTSIIVGVVLTTKFGGCLLHSNREVEQHLSKMGTSHYNLRETAFPLQTKA